MALITNLILNPATLLVIDDSIYFTIGEIVLLDYGMQRLRKLNSRRRNNFLSWMNFQSSPSRDQSAAFLAA